MTWFTFFCLWFTAGAYYPAQPQFTPSVQAGPVIMNPAPQQPQPPPQPAQHIPTKRERKQVQSAFLIQKCATHQTLCCFEMHVIQDMCFTCLWLVCILNYICFYATSPHVSLDRLNVILSNYVISKKKSLQFIKEETLYKKSEHNTQTIRAKKLWMNDFWNAEEGGGHTLTILLLHLVKCSQ